MPEIPPKIPSPSHYSLSELIARLREEPDQSRRVRVGFRNPHSYRGYYEQLAFEIALDVTVGEMLAAAESALGATFTGWKGGDYEMREYTETWLVRQRGESAGETLGSVLLSFMLQDQESAYRAGREDAARDIEKIAELAGWGEVWAQAVSIARGTVSAEFKAQLAEFMNENDETLRRLGEDPDTPEGRDGN